MKKCLIRAFLLSLVLVIGAVSVFAAGGRQSGPAALTAAINRNPANEEFIYLTEVARQYSAANNVAVEITQYPEYETVMRTRMAANDLPDLFSTHGWAVIRYGEFLEPLNNQPWASRVCPSIRSVITNDRGQLLVLPFDVDSAGVAFNRDVLDRVGIDPFAIRTWAEFMAACERIRAAGIIPVDIGGSVQDDWTVGNFYDWVAPSFLITDDRNNQRDALLNGTFDWNLWRPVAQLLVEFRDRNFLNPDYLQGTWDNVQARLGRGEVAFAFFGRYVITGAWQTNPNARLGFIPIPAHFPGDTPTFAVGENLTLGAWRSSPRKTEALAFLDHLSSTTVVNRLAQAANNSTGLVGPGYGIDTGPLREYFQFGEGIRGFPYFDRIYLPNGMWDSLCKTGSGLLANTMTMDQVITQMRNDYTNLRRQQQ